MKKIKYIFLVIPFFLFNISNVKALCSEEDKEYYKELANNLKFTYDFNMETKDFTVTLIGLNTNEIYLTDENNLAFSYNSKNSDGLIVKENVKSGNYDFKVVIDSSTCAGSLTTKILTLPKFNEYSQDKLCEGISGDDLAVCDEWYQYSISYETFKKRVLAYKEKIDAKTKQEETNKLLNLFYKYEYYIIGGVILILIIIITLIVRKKRGELK